MTALAGLRTYCECLCGYTMLMEASCVYYEVRMTVCRDNGLA